MFKKKKIEENITSLVKKFEKATLKKKESNEIQNNQTKVETPTTNNMESPKPVGKRFSFMSLFNSGKNHSLPMSPEQSPTTTIKQKQEDETKYVEIELFTQTCVKKLALSRNGNDNVEISDKELDQLHDYFKSKKRVENISHKH